MAPVRSKAPIGLDEGEEVSAAEVDSVLGQVGIVPGDFRCGGCYSLADRLSLGIACANASYVLVAERGVSACVCLHRDGSSAYSRHACRHHVSSVLTKTRHPHSEL